MTGCKENHAGFSEGDHEHIAYSTVSQLNIGGSSTNRLMLVLKTPGCAHHCVMCGFSAHEDIDADEHSIKLQYQNAIRGMDLSGIGRIDLLTAGSFFNDVELSRASRDYLFSEVSKLPVQSVLVESRAEYVTPEELKSAQALLRGNQTIEVGIGLETSNDQLRNEVIGKGLSRESFEKFVEICAKAHCRVLTYILVKPPTLSEAEAIEDAVESAAYAYSIANRFNASLRVAFKPMFIARGSELEQLYLKGTYKLPKLWTTIEIIRRTVKLPMYQSNSIFIGMFDEDLSDGRFSSNCSQCNAEVSEALKRFNGDQNLPKLEELTCQCKKEWQRDLGNRSWNK